MRGGTVATDPENMSSVQASDCIRAAPVTASSSAAVDRGNDVRDSRSRRLVDGTEPLRICLSS
jgi:hypothetical protein